MTQVPRHFFVDEAQAAQAYLDSPLPIGWGQTISQPYIVALMVEALRLTPHRPGCWKSASARAIRPPSWPVWPKRCWAVERLEPLFFRCRDNLSRLSFTNIHLVDDGTLGWPELAPYEAIIVPPVAPASPNPFWTNWPRAAGSLCPLAPAIKIRN